MELIWAGASPYARKVMIVAHELGLADQIKTTDGSGTPVAPNATTTSYNPLGKLPCLIPDRWARDLRQPGDLPISDLAR